MCVRFLSHACGLRLTLSYRVTDRAEFDWIKRERAGRSITDMEIRHAFLRTPYRPTHALAYQRDPEFLSQPVSLEAADGTQGGKIPEEDAQIFRFDHVTRDPNADPQESKTVPNEEVLALREEMRQGMEDHLYCRCRTYSCRYGGRDAEGKPVVAELQVHLPACAMTASVLTTGWFDRLSRLCC